jgi:hypothetical protein
MTEMEVRVEPNGWWTWECKTHGKAAFLHKTKEDAFLEAAQHNEKHGFSRMTKILINPERGRTDEKKKSRPGQRTGRTANVHQ